MAGSGKLHCADTNNNNDVSLPFHEIHSATTTDAPACRSDGELPFAAVANRSDHNDRSGLLHPTRQAEDKTAEPPQFVGICIAVWITIDLGMVLDPRIGVDIPKALECTFERVIFVRSI